MSDRKRLTLAKRIAREIFTSYSSRTGKREVASRLVVEHAHKHIEGSGYCEGAIADIIEKHLKAANHKRKE